MKKFLAAASLVAALALAPALAGHAPSAEAVPAPGIRPTVCKTIKVPPKDPWFLCMNLGAPNAPLAARCKPTYKVVCGY
jgi:hypothetical protein